jgi:hypothetical protein
LSHSRISESLNSLKNYTDESPKGKEKVLEYWCRKKDADDGDCSGGAELVPKKTKTVVDSMFSQDEFEIILKLLEEISNRIKENQKKSKGKGER